jgi:WD40 repeat protein
LSLWETTTGRPLLAAVQEQKIAALAWSPDGTHIALGVRGAFDPQTPNLFIVDAATLQTQASLHADGTLVSSVAWSPDSTRLAVAALQTEVREVSTGKVLLTIAPAMQVAWSPNGQYLATCDIVGPPLVWDASRGALLTTYRGHVGNVNALSWSSDSRFLASAGEDGTVQVWDASTGQHVFTYHGHGSYSIALVVWSPHGPRIASCDGYGAIHVWSATPNDQSFVFQVQQSPVFAIAWSPDGMRIASGGVLGFVEIWQPE